MAKNILITGTSAGIGLASARLFAQQGLEVWAAVRNPSKAEDLQQAAKDHSNIKIIQLDVQVQTSVNQAVNHVISTSGKIDILLNNAGAGHVATLEGTLMEELQHVMDVNFYGAWRCTQAVLPTMRQQKSGQIIHVTSVGGLIGQPFNDAYCAAKFALEGMAESMAPVLKLLGIKVSVVEPGPVNTKFVAAAQVSLQQTITNQPSDYQPMLNNYLAGSKQVFANLGQTPEAIAEVIAAVVQAENPHLRYQTSDFAKMIAAKKLADSTGDSIVEFTGARLNPA